MRSVVMALAGAVLMAAAPARAQEGNALAQAVATEAHSNETNMVSAAEAMPADKYGFKATPPQISFGDLIHHAAQANNLLCSLLAGEKAPETSVPATGSKDALVAQMKASFAFCDAAFKKIDPATLADEVPMFGRKMTKAWVIVHMALDWGDHYSQAAMMLRLNGIVPPSSQRRPAK